METRLWQWAEEQGLSMTDLADRLGYTARHLHRIRSHDYPITESFVARVTFRIGPEASRLFFCPTVSDDCDTLADSTEESLA